MVPVLKTMKITRLIKLAKLLDRGAPGVAFYLRAPRNTLKQALGQNAVPVDARTIRKQRKSNDLGPKDIACGVDGYAIELCATDYPQGREVFFHPFEQEHFMRTAVQLLGLTWIKKGPARGRGHDLFEPPKLACEDAPERVAEAVRREITGARPWMYPLLFRWQILIETLLQTTASSLIQEEIKGVRVCA